VLLNFLSSYKTKPFDSSIISYDALFSRYPILTTTPPDGQPPCSFVHSFAYKRQFLAKLLLVSANNDRSGSHFSFGMQFSMRFSPPPNFTLEVVL
jgi:hypothetical protein